ncbi:MAG: hypothetical protein RLZZ28_1214, partial [Bacteroidota bacterium]
MHKFFLSVLLLAFLNKSAAQKVSEKTEKLFGTISANILDNATAKPIPLASATLKSLHDSNLAVSQMADKNGAVYFEKLKAGYYQLSIRVIGFTEKRIDSLYIHPERWELVLGDTKLNTTSNSLAEVIVYAEKPLVENKDGKIVYNVAESPLSNGSNASEMLKNLPLMNANPDGSLMLRGREPLILMDEKPVNLSGQQLNDLLESLPANVVEKVEVMLNPPPEYATYPGGVINIITRKGKVGIYERISTTLGTKGEAAVSGNFNYRSSKLNIGSSLGFGKSELRGNSFSHRQNSYKDSVNYFYTESAFINNSKHPNGRVQMDYEFTKKSTMSLVYQGNINHFENSNTVLYTNRDSMQKVYRASTRSNQYTGLGYSHAFSGSYQWKGRNPVEKFQLYSGISFSKNENDRDFYQQFLQADYLPTGLDSTQVQLTDNYITSFYVNANYNKPLNDTGTIYVTTGVSYFSNTYHNILSTEFLRKTDHVFVGNELLSNNFYFRQHILTLRAALVMILPAKWRLTGGVGMEHTATEFEFIRGNAPDANNAYWRLLPNITLRKEFSQALNLSLVYRQTIRRPGITELNPSIDYSDPYNIRFGNPYLAPALTGNYDL